MKKEKPSITVRLYASTHLKLKVLAAKKRSTLAKTMDALVNGKMIL